MTICLHFCAALGLLWVAALGARAEDKPAPWQTIVRDASDERLGSLATSQARLVGRVNAYFNEITMLEGTFLQTAADGKQEHGALHIQRPGRFRFELAPPTRVVVISDGTTMSILDYNLNTHDRQDLQQTPFWALFSPKVDLMRDTALKSLRESDGIITVEFQDRAAKTGSVTLFLANNPARLKGWIVRDIQNQETRVDLTDLKIVDHIDPRLFDSAARLERHW
jgi:outer membrane lipoprotein-sorting protein